MTDTTTPDTGSAPAPLTDRYGVPVDATKSHGRGFVDGVLMDGSASTQVDWHRARHLLGLRRGI